MLFLLFDEYITSKAFYNLRLYIHVYMQKQIHTGNQQDTHIGTHNTRDFDVRIFMLLEKLFF